jgi:signal transduction histidine kinase
VKKSFQLRLILIFLACMVAVFLLNRFFSQQIASMYVHDRVLVGMAKVLQQCMHLPAEEDAFRSCADQARTDSSIESWPERYVVCDVHQANAQSAEALLCANLVDPTLKWADFAADEVTGFASIQTTVNQQSWSAVRQTSSGHVLMLQEEVIQRLVVEIWNIRNWVMQFVAPVIVLMTLMVGWLMTVVLLKPVNDIQKTLQKLSSKNLNEPLQVDADYQEFEAFTNVFEDLRGRLHNSFLQSHRFSADASHELRTPLTILRGHVELGIAELPAGSEAQIRLRLMGEEIERLIDITEKLLLLSRADADSIKLDMSDVNISELLNQMVKDARLFQSDLTITSNIQAQVVWHCDAQLIRQLIQNLCVNAVNYNLPSGWIDCQLHAQDGNLELTISNPTHEVVQDLSGRAFERFYRGDSAHTRHVDGHGLGLSLCIEIIHLHHGRISLTSDANHIVHVKVTAPLVPPQVQMG